MTTNNTICENGTNVAIQSSNFNTGVNDVSMITEKNKEASRVPKTVWYIGIYSMILNFSSSIVYAHMGLFVKNSFGAGDSALGIFEAVIVFASYASRLLSGVISDLLKNRKLLIFIGCLMMVFFRLMRHKI